MRDPMEGMPRAGDSSMWYSMCLATIGLSAALYVTGRKRLGAFIGLWPPTLAAMGNRAEINEEVTNLAAGRPIERIGGAEVRPRPEPFEGAEGAPRQRPAA